ncbi:MAG: T9SS type A sorting domain-containing protein, partial [Saprospiraceae bacterium]
SGGTPFPAPPPYTYSWSTGETGHFITGLPEATYTVTVTDSRGCTATTEVVVQFMVGTGSPAEGGKALLMYPNPAADWLRIVLPTHLSGQGGQGNLEGEWLAELADASGRVVLRESLPSEMSDCTLDLSGLPGGAYTVTLRDEGGMVFVGSVVKR